MHLAWPKDREQERSDTQERAPQKKLSFVFFM